jgi:predicted TIM-barrel fold metal-dependent hydrolase
MPEHSLYSCDDHLDINAMPPDAWVSHLPEKFKEAGPRVIQKDGRNMWTCAGKLVGVSGRFPDMKTALERVPGLDPDGLRAGKPKLRLEDMDRDGLQASIVYGPNALQGYAIADPEHKQAAIRAWNDWAAEEFNSVAPERLSALPMLPTTSLADAVAELQRAARQGHRGAILHCYEVNLLEKEWDRLWAAAVEVDLPISFHIGGGTRLNPMEIRQRGAFAAIAPMQMDEPLSIMIYGGALERFPRLKLVLAESGVGWLPYFIARMDATFEKHCRPYPEAIQTLPSELFRRQVWATFEEEPLGAQLLPLLPEDNLMWACDYPHPDSTWPDSQAAIDHAMPTLSPSARRKVTGETCRRLYRLD